MYEQEYKLIIKYSYDDSIIVALQATIKTIEQIAQFENPKSDFFIFCDKFIKQLCIVMEHLNKANTMFPGADSSNENILNILSKFTAFVNNKYNTFYQETCEELHSEVEILDSLFNVFNLNYFVWKPNLPSDILDYIKELDTIYHKYATYMEFNELNNIEKNLKSLNKLISYYSILYQENTSIFIVNSLKYALKDFKDMLVKDLRKLTEKELFDLDIDIDVLNTKLETDYGIGALDIRNYTN